MTSSNGGSGLGGGGVGWAALGPRPPPPLPSPDELAPLQQLQHANLFGGLSPGETPLLVPLTNGAATNLNFDESHGEAQEALIERYLALMGLVPSPRPAPSPTGSPLRSSPSETPDPRAGRDGFAPTPDLSVSFSDASGPLHPTQPRGRPGLRSLGLDRETLTRRGVPEALIGALHRGLAANAAAFFRSCLAEQRRLVLLTHGSGPAVPLADRLLAFITGTEKQLAAGSALPDMAELRLAKDTQVVLDHLVPPREHPPGPFHHELMYLRQRDTAPVPLATQPPGPEEEPDVAALTDLDQINVLAAAGNVPGLRALMRNLVEALQYTRTNLRQRLAAEGERAQRESDRGTAAREAVERLREQLTARNTMLAERGAEVEASRRRATVAEEALVTERAVVAGLRSQLRQLTLDYEAQHRELRAALEAQAAAVPVPIQITGLQPDPGFPPLESTDDPHAVVHHLGAQLATARSELALAELSCAQERAGARQLRVMLESVRATVDLHADRAAKAAAEVERLNRLVAASADLANASTGGLASLEKQLAQEKAAHRRTTERLQGVGWKFEQARSGVVDIRARAAHHLRKLQTALGDTNLRAVRAERQLGNVTIELRRTAEKLETTTNSWEALKERCDRQDAEMESLRREAITAQLDVKQVTEKLRETQTDLKVAEVAVAQMQQKVTADVETVAAGQAATIKLETLEKEHEQLNAAHGELKEAHESLTEAHTSLTAEMEAARERISELEVEEAQLRELTAVHNALVAAKRQLDQEHEELVKLHADMTVELAGMKKHADVLAAQVQEYRRLAERLQGELEAEKEQRRHTEEELAITAAKRDDLARRCVEMKDTLEALEERMKGVDQEVQRAHRTAELAGYQRAEAFAMRDAINKARMLLAGDMKEYLTLVEGEVTSLDSCLEELKASLAVVQSRLLDIRPETVANTAVELPTVPYGESQRMCEAVFKVVTHGSHLLETQAGVRKGLLQRIEHLEEGVKERLAIATEFWRQVLILSKGQPRSMMQIVERMTGQTCRDLDLDPANPLSRLVPLGALEEAGVQLGAQHERAGQLRTNADLSRAEQDAATKLLQHEREVNANRTSEFQALVDALSREVNRLKQRAGSLEANNVMQQRATAEMQRLLSDAEWKVAKAQEREALLGIKNMVPHGRETKAVQTVFSDLYMLTGGTVPTVNSQPPQSHRSQLFHQRSNVAESADYAGGGDMYGGFSAAAADAAVGGDGWRVVDLTSNDGSTAAAAAMGFEPPASPASLPPLSTINSPAQSWAGLGRPPLSTAASGGVYGSGLRSGGSLTGAPGPPPAGAPRLQSNLSRSSSSNVSPTGLAGLAAALASGAAAVAGTAAPRSGSPPDAWSAGLQPPQPSPSPQPSQPRRRHPDEVPRRSSALSPVPSVNSVASAGASETGGGSAALAVAGASGSGEPGSDGHHEGVDEDDEDFPFGASPSASPLSVLRTPSTSATAAAAAVFAAAASGGGAVPPHSATTSAMAAMPYGGVLPVRPATAGAALTSGAPPHPHTHVPRLSAAFSHLSRPGSPVAIPAPPTPSGIPHGWQYAPWDWLPDATPLTRGSMPYSRQALLEVLADIQYTKGLHDQVAAAASFPPTSLQQYIGAYFEARHGPRGSSPPAAEMALAQLLVSLEAHSALYDVILFARASGLQAWSSGKGTPRNGGNASRPATATSVVAASQPLTAPGRPRTSRAALNGLSPYTSGAAAAAAGGGGAAGLRQSSAAAAAAAARNRNLSARPVPGGGPSGPVMLGLLPSSARPATAPDGYKRMGSPPPSAPSGETLMRLRTGQPPAVASTSSPSHNNPHSRHSAGRSLSRREASAGAARLPGGPGGRPQLRVRPDLLVSEAVAGMLGRLGEVSGMESLSQYVSSGRILGRLRASDLGKTLRDEQHPELYFLAHRVASSLGLQEPPELLVRQTLPFGSDVMLLQLPNVGTSSLGVLATGEVDRQPAASAAAATSTAAGGWRRRAALLLSPALVQTVTAVLGEEGDVAAGIAAAVAGAGVEVEELQALMAAALAPMAMPGGFGWRFDVQGAGPSSGPGEGQGADSSPSPASAPSSSTPSPTLLSAAEVVTVVHLASLKPRALLAALPSQLQFQWDRLLSHLRNVAIAISLSADRGALLSTQAVGPSVRAVFRAAAGLGLALSLQQGPAGQLGRGEELVLQAQTLPMSDEDMAALASLPLTEVAAASPEMQHRYALARVKLLARWAESSEYRQTLRAAVM